jgi:hypothetical protein
MTAFTVPSEACQAQFQWTGVQTSFPCGFPALEATDLQVQYASGAAASFTGSIAGGVLTVTAIAGGALGPGAVLADVAAQIAPGTKITGYGSGIGGLGTYMLNVAQTVASEAMTSAGTQQTLILGVHYTVALDPLSGNATVTPIAMPDNGPGIVTVTRDTSAVQEMQFSNGESFQADALTSGYDRAEMGIAELKRRVGVLETVAFANPLPPGTAPAVPRQRSVTSGANLPITAADQIVNINAATDLAPTVPASDTLLGDRLEINNLKGSHLQTLAAAAGDAIDGAAFYQLVPDASVTLLKLNDGVNGGYKII